MTLKPLMTRRALSVLVIVVASITLSGYVTYLNYGLAERLSRSRSELEVIKSQRVMEDSLEGRRVADMIVTSSSGEPSRLSTLLAASRYSVVITEPPIACSSCLETSLGTWIRAKAEDEKYLSLPLFIVASGNSRRAILIAYHFHMASSFYDDSSGALYKQLHLVSTSPVAVFMNHLGRVVYLERLDWRHPEYFVCFLGKIDGYLTDAGD